MFSEKDLQTLLDHSVESQVLSVYLNTDPSEINTEAAKLRLRNLLIGQQKAWLCSRSRGQNFLRRIHLIYQYPT